VTIEQRAIERFRAAESDWYRAWVTSRGTLSRLICCGSVNLTADLGL
jgi:hypothetical protein